MSERHQPGGFPPDQPDTVARWQEGNWVHLSLVKRLQMGDFLRGEGIPCPSVDEQLNDDGPIEEGVVEGEIEPARCVWLGQLLYHPDMGQLCELWRILDPIPSISALPGDLIYRSEESMSEGRRHRGGDAWPTPIAVMFPDSSTYVAFLTPGQLETLLFSTDPEEADMMAALREAIRHAGGRMPTGGDDA